MATYYRDGPSLVPRPIDVIMNPNTGMATPRRGVSVFDQPDGLEHFGGVYEVGPIPPILKIVKTGRNPHHFEIAPADAMTFADYVAELSKIPKPI